jgi:hypothetical protein
MRKLADRNRPKQKRERNKNGRMQDIGCERTAKQGLDAKAVLRNNSHVDILNLVKSGAGLAALQCYLGDLEPKICRIIQTPPKM